ncbi:hypothetical protein QVD17_36083 [Tagetes erecta]|uniref:DNA-directed RNA polymerase n=1 Tax=Tagetes erecta TaxID=13708 RepID=A0AAD8JVM4_TARER|nr:hypothetical protein QVD17_36083 [Tagetes erecta]
MFEKTLVGQQSSLDDHLPVSCWKRKVCVKLVDSHIRGGGKVITVFLFSTVEIPIWLLFFALGVTSDKLVIDLIGADSKDNMIVNVLLASIYDADQKSKDFRKKGNAFNILADTLREKWTYAPKQAFKDCIEETLFPKLRGFNRKARYLGYMVKCLLEAYRGRRKVDDRDSFRSKRVELASELLEREIRVHLKHAIRRMTKALQRDLYGDRSLHPIEHYLDASIVTNGLSRAFSTGAWMMADMRRTRQQASFTLGKSVLYDHSRWRKLWVGKKFVKYWSCEHKHPSKSA